MKKQVWSVLGLGVVLLCGGVAQAMQHSGSMNSGSAMATRRSSGSMNKGAMMHKSMKKHHGMMKKHRSFANTGV